jgi:hypothetical protein
VLLKCALESNVAQDTLFHLFLVMSEILCEQKCWFELFCHWRAYDVTQRSATSPNGQHNVSRACVALV